MNRYRNSGFTLTEILIVVVIVGILLAIAFPQYDDYMRKAARAEAKGILLNIAQNEERYYTNNGVYLALSCPKGSTTGNCPTYTGSSTSSSRYDITVALQSVNQAFTITATPATGFSDPTCGNLTLTNTGVKGNSIGTSCW